jgi:hypothetical protein
MKKKNQRNKEEKVENIFCTGSKCPCSMKRKLAVIFPYHQPNCLTEAEYDSIRTMTTPEEELGEIYGRVFNMDSKYSEKRLQQLKRIAKEYK